MVIVAANFSFEDNRFGTVKKNQQFTVSKDTAKKYKDAGVMRIIADSSENPSEVSGKTLSALPAGQASREKTAKQSGRGGRKKQTQQ